MAGHPLRPAKDRRLGALLPHLLANPIWAHPMACGLAVPHFSLSSLCGISHSFPWLSPSIRQIPIPYSPVRHSSAKSYLFLLPSDLHVLGLPPAFNLSHDQTLQFNLALFFLYDLSINSRSLLSFSPDCSGSFINMSAHTDCLINF